MKDYNDQNWKDQDDPNNLLIGIICALIISLPIWAAVIWVFV